MAKVQHNRTTAASILQIVFSHITKCANKDGFHKDSHIQLLKSSRITISEMESGRSESSIIHELRQSDLSHPISVHLIVN